MVEPFMQMVKEIVSEDMQAIMELIEEDIIPFYKYKYGQEKKIANTEIKKMYDMEAQNA